MDGRQALAPGTVLKLSTDTGYTLYTINREVGRGGSCIVYDASYTDNLGNFKLVRVKECCPYGLRLMRGEDGALTPQPPDAAAFENAQQRLRAAYQKNHDLFTLDALTNAVANACQIYRANGTLYVVSVYMNGRTFAEFQGDTLQDCATLLRSAARVLQKIHAAGYLYLDLKPDNILTLQGSLDLVQLFDFDSMVSTEELQAAIRSNDPGALRTSYTRGYAPLEQQTGKLRQLGPHSDLYSLGAVFFYALWHRTPSAIDCDPDAQYDYARMEYATRPYPDGLFRALTHFFRHTLAGYPADRYPEARAAIEQLSEIIALSDETLTWVHSSPIPPNPVFYGRQAEMRALSDLLRRSEGGTACLCGPGGIGKSALVRQALKTGATEWDAVLWLYDQGDLKASVGSDALVHLHTVRRLAEETREEYLQRKIAALGAIAERQRVLLVIDNFAPEHLQQLEPFASVGWTTLLICREQLPEGLFGQMVLGEMDENALLELFRHYARCDLTEDTDLAAFRAIMARVNGHTLLAELIARQMAKSDLDIRRARDMIAGAGLRELPEEKIDYIRDRAAFHDTLPKILDRLVQIDRFSEEDKICMKLLSLFPAPGIDAVLFRELAELHSLDAVNDLLSLGWVRREGRQLYLHTVMLEYFRARPWTTSAEAAARRMMDNLYRLIRPAGTRHDGSKQFPADYDRLYALLYLAERMIEGTGTVTQASQRLLYRLLMDAPVDQDAAVLTRMLQLLADPRYLDEDSVLRLYETAAYLRARLYAPDAAVEILRQMRGYLRRHPSAYYLSAYHRAMAVILHNADELGNLEACLRHEDRAIAAARLSGHPQAKLQLAACLLEKAVTLLSADRDRLQARRLIDRAGPLIEAGTGPYDYERYMYACTAAMARAMDGDVEAAEAFLDKADTIAFDAADSDLSVAEHLIEQTAPIRAALGQYDAAAKAVEQAIDLCRRHEEALRYRETIFDAYLFLGRLYAMDGQYAAAARAYAEAEGRVGDSPYEWQLPLCPPDVRERAERDTHS